MTDKQTFSTGAVRGTDANSTRYDLITPIGLRRVAEAYAEGSKKYGDFNWERGIPISDLLNHAIRHLFLYLGGDTSEDHLGHAGWNVLAAAHSEEKWPSLNMTFREAIANRAAPEGRAPIAAPEGRAPIAAPEIVLPDTNPSCGNAMGLGVTAARCRLARGHVGPCIDTPSDDAVVVAHKPKPIDPTPSGLDYDQVIRAEGGATTNTAIAWCLQQKAEVRFMGDAVMVVANGRTTAGPTVVSAVMTHIVGRP